MYTGNYASVRIFIVLMILKGCHFDVFTSQTKTWELLKSLMLVHIGNCTGSVHTSNVLSAQTLYAGVKKLHILQAETEQHAASTEPWPPLFYDAHIGAGTTGLSEVEVDLSEAGIATDLSENLSQTRIATQGSKPTSLSGAEADLSNELDAQ